MKVKLLKKVVLSNLFFQLYKSKALENSFTNIRLALIKLHTKYKNEVIRHFD